MDKTRPFPRPLLNIAPEARWAIWEKGIGVGYQHQSWKVFQGYNGISIVEYSKGATSVKVRGYGLATTLNACNKALGLLTGCS